MIFLTVGTQLPFDRLVQLTESVAQEIDEEIFGQIGESNLMPEHFPFTRLMSPREFQDRVSSCRLIVGHAGMGTLLTAAKYQKPVAILARRQKFGEHRNDHQIATIEQMRKIPGVYAFETARELKMLVTTPALVPMSANNSPARRLLASNIQNFIAANNDL